MTGFGDILLYKQYVLKVNLCVILVQDVWFFDEKTWSHQKIFMKKKEWCIPITRNASDIYVADYLFGRQEVSYRFLIEDRSLLN